MSGRGPPCFFAPEEYRARWEKVDQAMATHGYDNLLVWQRGAGTFDRVGDVFWLTNFVMNGSGQDPASEEYGAPYTFSAVLIRRGREPELHVGLPAADLELTRVVCGTVVSHPENLMTGLAQYLRKQGIEGPVAVVGDDVLPGMYDRLLRVHAPQIEWRAAETLLWGPQSVKSSRELDAYRTAGELVTRALTLACDALLAGQSGAEAASQAAAVLLRAGGGFHRIDIHHGPDTERRVVSADLYGYHTTPPAVGEMVRVWIFGPIFQGYWLDPGRSLICGNQPTRTQRALLEGAVEVVDALVAAMRPGTTPRQLGVLGEALARKHGYFDHPQLKVPLLGHGLGTNFIPNLIPMGEGEADLTGVLRYDAPLEAGMVMGAEIFLTHPGVGTAGFEQNLIVTDTGPELLTRTPMLFW
ncbi:MAG TPA: M24 family metallopeptidase [Steroidobacteraceae bacterium]